jgi:hypothetical protein
MSSIRRKSGLGVLGLCLAVGCAQTPTEDETGGLGPPVGARDMSPTGPVIEDAFQGAPEADAVNDAAAAPTPDAAANPTPDAAASLPPDAAADLPADAAANPAPDAAASVPPDAAPPQPDVMPDAAPPPPDAQPDAAAILPDAGLACARDFDCPFDAFCVNGVCHAGGIACADVADCRAGDVCRLGFCAPGAADCGADADCVAGEICEGGACRPAQCLSDDECVAPAVCAEGRCGIPGAVEACNGLDDDGDGDVDEGALCPDAQLCRRGECVVPACVDGETRLVGGATPNDGRLEICLRGVWGTVCIAGFDARAARIACGSAGLPTGAATFGGSPGGAQGRPIWLVGFRCAGDESNLLECAPAEELGQICTHDFDVGLTCPEGPPPEACNGLDDNGDGAVDEGEPCGLRARCIAAACVPIAPESCNGADDDLNGLVDDGVLCGADERCLQGECRAVAPETCNGVDDDLDGQLDEGELCPAGERCVAGACAPGPQPETCNGIDDDLDGAVDDGVLCANGEACIAGACVITPCDEGRLRLVNGPTPDSGRVEICHAAQWGTVCDDAWDAQDAAVVCRQLGFGPVGAQAINFATYGQGVGQIWLDNVACGGGEGALAQCAAQLWGDHNCAHSEDAGVICGAAEVGGGGGGACVEGQVRLVDGGAVDAGRVEICHAGRWGTVCDDAWDDADAAVVCRQLGLPSAGAFALSVSAFGEGVGDIWLDEVGCLGVEASLAACANPGWGLNDCGHIEDASVICGP